MNTTYDIIIIGTGPGGSTIAHALAPTGKKILILERGDFLVRSKENWDPEAVWKKAIYMTQERWLTHDNKEFHPHITYMVGGQSKVFGAALIRMRQEDFGEIIYEDGVSPAWPIRYEDMEPYYTEAERLYFVHGERGEDPTEPPASKPYAYPKLRHERRIQEVSDQLKSLGLRPFHMPVGVKRFADRLPQSPCILCNSCDGFPCPMNAKGDAEQSALVHALAYPNVTLLTNAKAERIETNAAGTQVEAVVVSHEGISKRFEAGLVISSAGAVNSAILLLKSANPRHPRGLGNSSGLLGKNYMAHNNSAMLSVHPFKKNPTQFQKTIGINDFYFGTPGQPIGHISLLGKATEGILRTDQPLAPRAVLRFIAEHSVDWWFTTEDLPRRENGVELTAEGRIRLNYTPNNTKPHQRLLSVFKRYLWKSGFRVMLSKTMPINKVAHQVGTALMGKDPGRSVLNTDCRSHDVEGLYVVDGSFFPSSGAVNPALTIAANALRVGDRIKETVFKEESRHVVS